MNGNPETANDPTGHCSSILDLSCDWLITESWLGDVGSTAGGWLGDAAGVVGDVIGAVAEDLAGPIDWGIMFSQVINAVFNPPKLDCGCITSPQAPAQSSSSSAVAYPGGIAVNPSGQSVSNVIQGIRDGAKAANIADAGNDYAKRDRQNYGGAYLQLGYYTADGVFVPVAGYVSPPLLAYNTDYHVEDQATDWAIAMIKWYNSQPGHKPITAVRLDIFSFQPPCDLCGGYHGRDGYAVDIMEHVPTVLNAEVTIWTPYGVNGSKAPITPIPGGQ